MLKLKKVLPMSLAVGMMAVTSSTVFAQNPVVSFTEEPKVVNLSNNINEKTIQEIVDGVDSSLTTKDTTNIAPRKASHLYSNFKITSGTNFETTIELSKSDPYGKAHYYNSSDYIARLYVGDEEEIIEPHSGGSIVWKKTASKSSYKVKITASQDRLNGTFSLAKASDKTDFQ